jgi:DNA-binding CsgD family transcriptional regulator
MATPTKPPSPKRSDSSSPPQEQHIVIPVNSEYKLPSDPDVQRRHLLIEVLISRHEEMIDNRLRAFARRYPAIGEDAVRSTFLLRLTKSCLNQNLLLDLQDENLNSRDLVEERRIIGGTIKFAGIDELRKLRSDTKSFSQLGDFDPGQIANPVAPPPATISVGERAVRLADRLHRLNVTLTDRQFNVLLCKLTGATENGAQPTHEQVAEQLNISPKTVQRDMAVIKSQIYQAKTGQHIDRAPDTTTRREDFREILANRADLQESLKQYMEVYVELTADGQRPHEQEMCAKLGINENQLKNRQRRAKLLRTSSVRGIT